MIAWSVAAAAPAPGSALAARVGECANAPKRPVACAGFAASSRALALHRQARCDYVRSPPIAARADVMSSAPGATGSATIACRIDLARERIETLE